MPWLELASKFRNVIFHRFLTTSFLFFAALEVQAGNILSSEEIEQKKDFTFFHPTPQSLMRDFVTDRPSRGDSPFTVDAGHFQFETDLVSSLFETTVESGGRTRTAETYLNNMNLKFGLAHDLDLQLIFESFKSATTKVAGSSRTKTGIGDTTLRLKKNFFGNDGGDYSLGLIFMVTIPTSAKQLDDANRAYGASLPFTFALLCDWQGAAMIEYSAQKQAGHPSFTSVAISTLSAEHSIGSEKLSGYLEIYSELADGQNWLGTFDTGLTYEFIEDWQVDAGINFGLTAQAENYNPFLGLSARF